MKAQKLGGFGDKSLEINLRINKIDSEAKALAEALQTNTSLKTISWNKIDSEAPG